MYTYIYVRSSQVLMHLIYKHLELMTSNLISKAKIAHHYTESKLCLDIENFKVTACFKMKMDPSVFFS